MPLIKPGTRRKRGPSQSIVRLASSPSRRSALLRPRWRAANGLDRAVRQPHAAIVDGPHEQRPYRQARGTREPLDDAHRPRYCDLLFRRLRFATPSVSLDAEHANRRPQVAVRSLLSTHSLVDHSRDDRSADHAIVAGLRCGLRSQLEIRSLNARAHTLDTSCAHVPDLQS